MLMKEIPSPNVTHTFPDLLDLSRFPRNFRVTSHGRGVFEFNPVGDCWEGARSEVENAFWKYDNLKATYPVTITGAKVDSESCRLAGSTRFCTMDRKFAEYLTSIVAGRSAIDVINTDRGWEEMVNVSQYFRFMCYSTGGEHFPHYDSDFNYEYNEASTKYSLVVYFNKCESGEIAFINDTTEHATDRSDWTRQATDEEIWLKIKPSSMKIVLFPHTLCHTVLPFVDKDNKRYICRGDVLFKQVKK